MISFSGQGLDGNGLIAVPKFAGTADSRCKGKVLQLMILPSDVKLEAAAGLHTFYFAVGKGGREGGKKIDHAVLTLQQHLREAGRAAEVAVYLEGRMGIEHIRIDTAMFAGGADGIGEEFVEEFEGVVAVVEAGPAVDLPGEAPARAFVATIEERLPCSTHHGAVPPGNVGTRKDAPEMGDMPMGVGGIVLVFEPFLELTMAADGVGCELLYLD